MIANPMPLRRWLLISLVASSLFGSANARVTTSKVLCDCVGRTSEEAIKSELGDWITESKSIGRIEGIAITLVALDVSNTATRERYRRRISALLAIIENLGVKDVESAVDFVEADPKGYDCKNSSAAVNIEFVFKHE
jgi:hypothetical protein